MTRTLKDIQQHTLVRIVDDNEDLRETCEMMLTYAGWQVRTYAGAWSFLMDDAPSVPGCLILDISMPDMTGTELQMEMRRRRYSLPIIILTGHANVDLAVTTLKAGAAEFFEKPVDEDRLMKSPVLLVRCPLVVLVSSPAPTAPMACSAASRRSLRGGVIRLARSSLRPMAGPDSTIPLPM